MRALASMKTLDLWYSRVGVEDLMGQFRSKASANRRKLMEKNLAKTRAKDSLRAFGKLTTIVDGQRRIISDPPLIVPIEELAGGRDAQAIEQFARDVTRGYRRTLQGDRRHLLERFRYVHAARKVVGVGSVGTRAWIVLMVGRDNEDPLFLQLKEAQTSVLEPFLAKSQYTSHGQRVVEGQRLMQAASDIMLGWHRVTADDGVKRDFYFRQLWDNKGSAIIEGMSPRELTGYAEICGRTLARAHARSGDCSRDYRLHRIKRRAGQLARRLRRAVRRPERARLRRRHRRRQERTRQGADRALAGTTDRGMCRRGVVASRRPFAEARGPLALKRGRLTATY